jgi:hypothetical protein
MKIEFDLPNNYKDKTLILCLKDDPVSLIYINVYEEGDVWIKIKGCETCSWEKRKMCCGTCPMNTKKGCFFHLDKRSNLNKPYHCVVNPTPIDCQGYCEQEFKCIKGFHTGKTRKISLPGDKFL